MKPHLFDQPDPLVARARARKQAELQGAKTEELAAPTAKELADAHTAPPAEQEKKLGDQEVKTFNLEIGDSLVREQDERERVRLLERIDRAEVLGKLDVLARTGEQTATPLVQARRKMADEIFDVPPLSEFERQGAKSADEIFDVPPLSKFERQGASEKPTGAYEPVSSIESIRPPGISDTEQELDFLDQDSETTVDSAVVDSLVDLPAARDTRDGGQHDALIADEEFAISGPDSASASAPIDMRVWYQQRKLEKQKKAQDLWEGRLMTRRSSIRLEQRQAQEEAFNAAMNMKLPPEVAFQLADVSLAPEKKIGEGTGGKVYKAEKVNLRSTDRERQDEKNRRYVALKTFHPSDGMATDDRKELMDNFLREAKTLARIDHPNIVPVYDAGMTEDGTDGWYTMPLSEGSSLFEVVTEGNRKKETALSYDALADIFSRVAAGLAAVHEKDIIHRDVKPENILLDAKKMKHGDASYVRLADFGVATETMDVRPAGTPYYMDPNIFRKIHLEAKGKYDAAARIEVGKPSDVYSLGASLHHMLTGKVPFQKARKRGEPSETPAEIVKRAFYGKLKPPIELRADVPQALSDLVMAAMQKNSTARPTAQEFSERLREIADDLGGRSSTKKGEANQASPSPKKRSFLNRLFSRAA